MSVGEVLLLRPLVRELARRRPGWEVVISTTTSTGLAVARRTYPDLVTFYAPLDFSWATRRAMARIRPTVLALVELELWPNLIRAAKRSGRQGGDHQRPAQPAQLSRLPTAPRGRWARRSRRIDVVAAQNEDMPRRFVDLGVPGERVSVTGSVKYDGLESDRNNAEDADLAARLWAWPPADLVFVAGSTMEGEEAAALAAYRAARRSTRGSRLVLVPRHAERFDERRRLARAAGRAGRRAGAG